MIKLIIFDIGKVILDFDHHITCRHLAEKCHYLPTEIYNMVFEGRLFYQYEKGRITSRSFYEQVKTMLSLNMDYKQFARAWGDIFSLMPQIEPLMEKLKGKARLFALSNTDELHFQYLYKQFPLFKQFEQIVLSYEVNARKPEPAIYSRALELARVPAENSLLVDDLGQNVEAFLNMGGKGLVFEHISGLYQALRKYQLL
ncbi:MAG: HAD-IA family hydrolase [Actinomycetota bacterium]|nr:HAD-IA family hydrolase [Actinomycetota bacterium]